MRHAVFIILNMLPVSVSAEITGKLSPARHSGLRPQLRYSLTLPA
jgi:hypothetical protein